MAKFCIDKIRGIALSKNKEFCSEKYLGAEFSYDFKCLDCEKIFVRKYGNFTQNPSCPCCNLDSRKYYNKKDNKHWIDVGNSKGLTLLSKTYINARTPLEWQCNTCLTRFNNAPCNIKAGSGCPKCANGTSKPEESCREIFELFFNKDFPSIRPDFLKNPTSKLNLELDGYCEELKLAFEYDGEFHYKEIPYADESTLEKQQERDRLKDALCKINGVKLIRIPYTEKQNLKLYIEEQLWKL